MGKRVSGRTAIPTRRYVNIRVGQGLAQEVAEVADDLGVSAGTLYVLGAALLVRRAGTGKRRMEVLAQVRAEVEKLLP